MNAAELWSTIFPYVVLSIPVALFLWRQREAKQLARTLEGQKGYVGADISFLGLVKGKFKLGAHRCAVRTNLERISQQRPERYWRVVVEDVKVAKTTPFTVHLENAVSRASAKLGAVDIEVGIPGFDDVYCVYGDDRARVRGLLSLPKVRALIVELFVVYGATTFALRRDGTLRFRIRRRGGRGTEMATVARVATNLARVLDAHKKVSPLPAPPLKPVEVPQLSSVSGGSGVPVGMGTTSKS